MSRLLDALANIAQFVIPALLIAWADRQRPSQNLPHNTSPEDSKI
jgi:hypothetical protein